MERARNQFLAGPAFAQDQHGGVGRRHFGDLALQVAQLIADTHHPMFDLQRRLEALVLSLQPSQDGSVLPGNRRHAGHRRKQLQMTLVEALLRTG